LIYNLFIAGLTFNSFINMIGMVLNPASAISINGLFYILGIVVYALVLFDALKSLNEKRTELAKIRMVIKATLMALIILSPVPLFAAMALIDVVVSAYEYKVKLGEWVVPKLWLANQVLCIVGYAALIFLSNMLLGLIVGMTCVVAIIGIDSYLHYKEYVEMERIQDLGKVGKNKG
jgi:hypothetical protein